MSVRGVLGDVSVRLGATQALNDVNLVAEPGKFLALLGPSGSGKTTTLNVLAGFVRPDSGRVAFDERDMTPVLPHDRDIGFVFQGYALFPHMTVAENVAFPLRMRRVARSERARRVMDALELVDLEGFAKRSVKTLSGGQQQRVALARAIVFEPSMLLLDEPLAALDKQLRDVMQLELKRLQRRLGITTVAVTHDQVEALTMADAVAVMRDGHIEQIGSPQEVYTHPRTLFVATFLGEANVLPAHGGQLPAFGRLQNRSSSGHAVIRPEQIRLGDASDPTCLQADATVEEMTFQGARIRARVRLNARSDLVLVVADVPRAGAATPQAGQQVVLSVRAEAVHVIAAEEHVPESQD